MEHLGNKGQSQIEPLEKKCPRCGGKSANSSNPSGRCRACLNKLASNKKKVGHYLHEHKVADDALRRQKGKNGTAHKKSKGLGSRKQIMAQTHAAEKKAGQVLSPDRKDNSKGYSASNTRMVPPKLNRGRHHVDGKKLRAWQKRLKKTNLTDDEFYTLVLAKAYETADTASLQLLEDMHPNDFINFLNNEDTVESLGKSGSFKPQMPQSPPSPAGGVKPEHQQQMFDALSFHESPPSAHILVRAHRGEDMSPEKSEAVYNAATPFTSSRNISAGMHPGQNPDLFHDNEVQRHLKEMSPEQFHNLRNTMLDILHERWEAGYDDREGEEDQRNQLMQHIRNLTAMKHPLKKTEFLGKAAPDLSQPHNMPAIHNEIGKTHTVEIHPDIDHLYNVKAMAKQDPRGRIKVADVKSNPLVSHLARKVPRNAEGWITPEMIDEHIKALPKQKVNIKVLPYNWGSQQHRRLPLEQGKHQYAVSMELHPETLNSMSPEDRKLWDAIGAAQHTFESNESPTQFGWSRVDPWKSVPEYGPKITDPNSLSAHDQTYVGFEPNHGHWHLDEIQSDFQNKEKMQDKVKGAISKLREKATKHPDVLPFEQRVKEIGNAIDPGIYNAFYPRIVKETPRELVTAYKNAKEEYNKKLDEIHKKMVDEHKDAFNSSSANLLKVLSHGHEDPQHAIHSAVNALGRKMGVNSISMDMPNDQAKQSALEETTGTDDEQEAIMEEIPHHHDDLWQKHSGALRSGEHPAYANPNFKSALDKLGGPEVLDKIAAYGPGSGSSADLGGNIEYAWDGSKEGGGPEWKRLRDVYDNMSGAEIDAVNDLLFSHQLALEDAARDSLHISPHNEEVRDLPVHQKLTYDKRPKKLGATIKDKKEVLGDDPFDDQKQVQYMNLHKKLKLIRDLMKKAT